MEMFLSEIMKYVWFTYKFILLRIWAASDQENDNKACKIKTAGNHNQSFLAQCCGITLSSVIDYKKMK